jgi:branched-chain amino acid transport system substrate-binding protein
MILPLFLVVALVLTVSQAQEQPVFRIGVLDSERGDIASGARLAVQQINDAGGVQGAEGTIFRLELVVEATAEGDTLADAIGRLEAASVVAVLGPGSSEQVLSDLPLLQSLGVPILTPATGDTISTSVESGIFRIRVPELVQASALADYLFNQLSIGQVTIVQLDLGSTVNRVGFSLAVDNLDSPPATTDLLLEELEDLPVLVQEIVDTNPQLVAAFGPPDLASQFYDQARLAGWVGIFVYGQAQDDAFGDALPLEELRGVISTTTWPLSAIDEASDTFLNSYVRAFGEVPTPVAAASYDAIQLLAAAITLPGPLAENLANLGPIQGVQGVLNPAALEGGELSNNVAIIQLGALGGPEILARYAGLTLLPPDQPPLVEESGPTATPTLDGVFIRIESNVQNVRTGPGLEYDVLGQLRQGETARVLGATVNFDWVVIEFRGQQGWLATYLLEVIGDRSTVPVIAPPPTPTPPPATPTPTPAPVADIIIVSAAPSQLTRGIANTINVTVQNAGTLPAGAFAIAATFPPDNVFAAANLPGLAGGQQVIVPLTFTPNGATGNFNVVIVADLNQQVNEGPTGEANNDDFTFNYRIDRPLILINSATLTVGTPVDLEGNVTPITDIVYTATGLNTVGSCTPTANCIGLISPALSWDTSHYDAISATTGVNTTFIANAALTPGATIGVLTAEGRRGVIRVDAVNPGVSITITYRIYQ